MTRFSTETLLKAREAAEELKQQLLERFGGQHCRGWSCSCGGVGMNASTVVDIDYPGSAGLEDYPEMVGLWSHWTVDGKETGSGQTGSVGNVSGFVPIAELYALFRNIFEPIGVPVEHPLAGAYFDRPDPRYGDLAAKAGRRFTPSGRTVVVRPGSPQYVQPIGDRSQSTWLNAELRVEEAVEDRVDQGFLMACNVDPFGVHYSTWAGGRAGSSYVLGRDEGVQDMVTFYVDISAVRDIYAPMARLVAYDATTGAHTFELDAAVEHFAPGVSLAAES